MAVAGGSAGYECGPHRMQTKQVPLWQAHLSFPLPPLPLCVAAMDADVLRQGTAGVVRLAQRLRSAGVVLAVSEAGARRTCGVHVLLELRLSLQMQVWLLAGAGVAGVVAGAVNVGWRWRGDGTDERGCPQGCPQCDGCSWASARTVPGPPGPAPPTARGSRSGRVAAEVESSPRRCVRPGMSSSRILVIATVVASQLQPHPLRGTTSGVPTRMWLCRCVRADERVALRDCNHDSVVPSRTGRRWPPPVSVQLS
jgi:hypothetical protein